MISQDRMQYVQNSSAKKKIQCYLTLTPIQ